MTPPPGENVGLTWRIWRTRGEDGHGVSAGAVGAEGSAPPGQEQVPGSAAEKLRGGTGPGSLITFLAGESENFTGELSGLGGAAPRGVVPHTPHASVTGGHTDNPAALLGSATPRLSLTRAGAEHGCGDVTEIPVPLGRLQGPACLCRGEGHAVSLFAAQKP